MCTTPSTNSSKPARAKRRRATRLPSPTAAGADMALILDQRFLLGRFHATRWNQNPFEDPHGEWPPSPWRLLRALAARWAQYSRETGDDDPKGRDELLRSLARQPPAFRLPESSWRGPDLRQYQ